MMNLLLPLMVFMPVISGVLPVFVKDLKKLNKIIVVMCITELAACL